ncbi:hypothetical protein [Nitrosomonas ureae]|uniref:Uncharacterized protein n=1 Tax=Nitrosomonas ureae TaxID=44577 RepID=A0A1H2F643_9PROT|nr:hypothetical protein [Nitrosomonas ureae]ALQ50436.1 hypothetical protein ATY38_03805 [Nitrosomonas ureae]SDU02797.1 hypothetical protein SAMN05216406_11816 [Nitrosomonas ureae]
MNEIEHEIEIAKLKADLEKSKSANRYQLISTALGTFLASVFGTSLLFIQNTDKNLQEFDDGHREFISKFVEVAMDADMEPRRRLAHYFAFVTLDEKQRSRWEEYAKYLEELNEETEKKVDVLKEQLHETISDIDRLILETQIRNYLSQLEPFKSNDDVLLKKKLVQAIILNRDSEKEKRMFQSLSQRLSHLPACKKLDSISSNKKEALLDCIREIGSRSETAAYDLKEFQLISSEAGLISP